MGGYAFYVWGSYAVTFALLAFESYAVLKRFRRARQHP
jgi:heme exporter protein CcmD